MAQNYLKNIYKNNALRTISIAGRYFLLLNIFLITIVASVDNLSFVIIQLYRINLNYFVVIFIQISQIISLKVLKIK